MSRKLFWVLLILIALLIVEQVQVIVARPEYMNPYRITVGEISLVIPLWVRWVAIVNAVACSVLSIGTSIRILLNERSHAQSEIQRAQSGRLVDLTVKPSLPIQQYQEIARAKLETLGFAQIGIYETRYGPSGRALPVWVGKNSNGTTQAYVFGLYWVKKPVLALQSTFDNGFVLETRVPKGAEVDNQRFQVKTFKLIEQAVKYHAHRLTDLEPSCGNLQILDTMNKIQESSPKYVETMAAYLKAHQATWVRQIWILIMFAVLLFTTVTFGDAYRLSWTFIVAIMFWYVWLKQVRIAKAYNQ